MGEPEEEAQLLDAEICAGEVAAALPGVIHFRSFNQINCLHS